MPTIKSHQTNFSSGVIDPLAAVREDVAFFYNGLEDATNVLNFPQGGVRRRPGNQHVAELAPVLSAISYSGSTATAPEGGTASNATDGNEATLLTTVNNLSTTNPFVIFHVDFAVAKSVLAVDVINYALSTGALSDELRVQYSTDNASWNNFATAFDADVDSRSRRLRADTAVSARYWRFARIGATSLAATVSVAEVKFWAATATLSNARLVPFNHPTAEVYMLLATDGNMDVFVGDTRTAAIAIGHTSSQLAILNWTQQRDTLLLFHSALTPFKVFRQGADDEFDFRKLVFSNIPQFDYGAGTGGVNEVQRINISGALDATHKFTILLDGERTTVINGDATPATVATNIQTALRALSNTSASGITVASVTDGYDVTFGGDDGKQPWGLMSVSILAGNSVVDVARTTEGEYEGEDIMSDTRGWPRTGALYQSRLHMGGIPQVGDALLSSAVGDYFDLDINRDDDTKALLTRSEAGDSGSIYQIVPGRHLTLFTSESELYIPQEPISENSVPKLTTRTGSKEGIPVYEVDGALTYIQGVKDEESNLEVGTSLREYLYIDTEQSYASENLSKLSSHLIKDPVDLAKRPAISTSDADIMLIVNNDGTLTAQTTLRSDIVNALIPQTTNGKFLAARVDKKRRAFFVVERVINGVTRRFLERWNENLRLDGGGIATMTYEEFTATEGQTVFTYTFTSPGTVAEIGARIDGGRLTDDQYSVNLGAKTVTLDEGVAAGTVVRIAYMIKVITGLDHLAGETVMTIVDGTAGDEVAVTAGGVLTLADYADTEIQYGFDYQTYGKLMPFRVPGGETLAGEKVRVCRAILSLFETGSIEIRANLGRWREIRLLKTDSEVLDRSTMETLFTGEIDAKGLMGCEVGGYFEFRQTSPDPLTIRAITREVAY
ncbi:MAG: discoidin domain-containing protein [Alphaproteobacteria bacterium]|jgi:hypothetical protein